MRHKLKACERFGINNILCMYIALPINEIESSLLESHDRDY